MKIETYGKKSKLDIAFKRAVSLLKKRDGFIPVGMSYTLKRKVLQFDRHGKQFPDNGWY